MSEERLISAREQAEWLESKISQAKEGKGSYYRGYQAALETVLSTVQSFAPAVDPVRHGHWILDGYFKDQFLICSECGQHGYDELTSFGWQTIRADYCSHCGAKMDQKVTE